MSLWAKILIAVVVVALAAFVGSKFLVSKLDGTGTPAPQAQTDMLQYSSEDGYTFLYPDTYEISSYPGYPGEGDWLVLAPPYIPPQGGEGPPSISIHTFSLPPGIGLEEWIRSDSSRSTNFYLSDGTLTPTTIGGKPAFSFRYSGLYENDAAVATANGKAYLFNVGWLDANDQLRTNFYRLLETVEFI